MSIKAPYGTWKSPISADILNEKSIYITDTLVDPVTGLVYHCENRPSDEGRTVPVASKTGEDMFGAGWIARSRVHEYGGSCTAVRDGVFYFSDGKSGRIARIKNGGEPEFVTPDNSNHRFADFVIHPTQPHHLIAVFEDHTNPKPSEVLNKVVAINTLTSTVTVLAEDADFYSFPRVSPNGERLAFVQWFHPNMSWDSAHLLVADLKVTQEVISLKGADAVYHVAGKEDESVSQPVWNTSDTLIFTSDASGFSNPWIWDAAKKSARPLLPSPLSVDFDESGPCFGDSRLVALSDTLLLVAPLIDSKPAFGVLDVNTGATVQFSSPYVDISHIRRVSSNEVVFIGTQDEVASGLIKLTLKHDSSSNISEATFETLKTTSDLTSRFPPGLISRQESFALPNPDLEHPLHLHLALPRNPEYDPSGSGFEKPPCIIKVHGGPTHRTYPGLSWLIQYFTSRGWAFCSVDHRGSTGFGRDYREQLKGRWGIVDVADCATAVKLLGEKGLIDPKRVAIRGGSAGGYTTLQALVNYPDLWTAGCSSYGVSDLVALTQETHKYESQYLFKLLGGTAQEVPQIYHDRSPVYFAEKITAPTLILQGADDKVVPQNQAEMMVKKIKGKGGKVKCIVFEGEGHGWRKSSTVKRALEEELGWYEEVFGLVAK